MKHTLLALVLTTLLPLKAALADQPPSDPFAGAFFPPELVLQAYEQIGMTPEQMEAIHARLEKVQSHSEELRQRLESETAALMALIKQDRVDEAALTAQLDKVLDAERDLKHLHVGLLAAIKNTLTPEQQTKLREMAKSGGDSKVIDETRQRLTTKVEAVKAEMEKWANNGRDPSEFGQEMQEKFKPLIDAGKAGEAEAVLDHVLQQLKGESK